MTNNNSSTVSQIVLSRCAFNVVQLQWHAVTVEISFYLLTLLGVLYPIAILAAVLTAVSIFTIRGWKSSTRRYYYVISVANLVAVLFVDYETFLLALSSWATLWFPNGLNVVSMLHWELYWAPLCAVFNFVSESIILPKLWVLILLCVHRTWIVLEPLRAPLLKRVFHPALVFGLPIGLTVLIIPQLWLSLIKNG